MVTSSVYLSAHFSTGGILSRAYLEQTGSNVSIRFVKCVSDPHDQWQIQWQIHELPVDFTIDPKQRCRPEHVGRCLQHSGGNERFIVNVNISSLVLHSIIILVNDTLVTCGTIIPFDALPKLPVTHVMFKSGVFGKMYNFNWPSSCEYEFNMQNTYCRS